MLWIAWMELVWELRPAFSHMQTFCWAIMALLSFSVRNESAGITSFVRASGLRPKYYPRMLDFFQSSAIDLQKLTALWVRCCLKVFGKHLVVVNRRIVLLADGIKVPKFGRKMPGVKLLFQSSENENKAPYFMGHSCQSVSLLVRAGMSHFSVPLATRIHEGYRETNRDKRTLMGKLLELMQALGLLNNFYLVADAYYSVRPIIRRLNGHLIYRMKLNVVAYEKAKSKIKGRGRPKKYGKKIKLWDLFRIEKNFKTAISPVYGEDGVKIQYRCCDLIWKGAGKLIRFILVVHPTRGKCILMSTDTELAPLEVIKLYGLLFKIEVGVKQAVHHLGAFSYRFWMKDMEKSKRKKGTEHLHRKDEDYRKKYLQKFQSYQVHIQLGMIAQGLLQYLSVCHTREVWENFGSWLRTIREDIAPSEMIVSMALRPGLLNFLRGRKMEPELEKFLEDRIDFQNYREYRLAS